MHSIFKPTIFAVSAALLLTACGNDLSGNIYEMEGNGGMRVTFEDEYVDMMGMGLMPYTIDDDKVLIGQEGAQQVWRILDDGNLEGMMGMLFVPVDD